MNSQTMKQTAKLQAALRTIDSLKSLAKCLADAVEYSRRPDVNKDFSERALAEILREVRFAIANA